MRFLHTSDWHLGRLFHGVHLTSDQWHVLQQLIAVIKDVKPDVVLVAGDIYDRAVPPTEAVKLLNETLREIVLDTGVPVVMIAGNHDSPERLSFGSELFRLQNLHTSGLLLKDFQPLTLADKYGPVDFFSIPYAEPAAVKEVLQMPEIHDHVEAMSAYVRNAASLLKSNRRSVLITHAFVAGCAESESERPLAVGGTAAIPSHIFEGFHYVALGHLHQPQRAGAEHIRYSGSLMKYSFSEAKHNKEFVLVDMDEQGGVKIETIPIAARRDVRIVRGLLADIVQNGSSDPHKDDYIKAELLDNGLIFDAIGQLRSVYPNTMQLERVGIERSIDKEGHRLDHRKISPPDLFEQFFVQVTGEEFDNQYKREVETVWHDIEKAKEEISS